MVSGVCRNLGAGGQKDVGDGNLMPVSCFLGLKNFVTSFLVHLNSSSGNYQERLSTLDFNRPLAAFLLAPNMTRKEKDNFISL
jgi:hypothetical protein